MKIKTTMTRNILAPVLFVAGLLFVHNAEAQAFWTPMNLSAAHLAGAWNHNYISVWHYAGGTTWNSDAFWATRDSRDIAIDEVGQVPYVEDSNGDIWKLSGSTWGRVPMGTRCEDGTPFHAVVTPEHYGVFAVNGGALWALDTQKVGANYKIRRLLGGCWVYMDGAATNIAYNSTTFRAFVTCADHTVWYYHPGSRRWDRTNGAGKNVGNGLLVGTDDNIYSWNGTAWVMWMPAPGPGYEIRQATWSGGQAWATATPVNVPSNTNVYTVSFIR